VFFRNVPSHGIGTATGEGFSGNRTVVFPAAEKGRTRPTCSGSNCCIAVLCRSYTIPAMLERLSIATRIHKTTGCKERAAWFLEISGFCCRASRLPFLEEYEANLRQLRQNANRKVRTAEESPREGPALLRVGSLRAVRKRMNGSLPQPRHAAPSRLRMPERWHRGHGQPVCQSIKGAPIDKTISDLLFRP